MACVAAFQIATGALPRGPADLAHVRLAWVSEIARLRAGVRRADGADAAVSPKRRPSMAIRGRGKRMRASPPPPPLLLGRAAEPGLEPGPEPVVAVIKARARVYPEVLIEPRARTRPRPVLEPEKPLPELARAASTPAKASAGLGGGAVVPADADRVPSPSATAPAEPDAPPAEAAESDGALSEEVMESGTAPDRTAGEDAAGADGDGPQQQQLLQKIDATGEVVRIARAGNRAEMAQVVGGDAAFVPLVFPRAGDEPAHVMTGERGVRDSLTGLPLHQAALDGFPEPVDPERWLRQQRIKYGGWESDGWRVTAVENVVQQRPCRSAGPRGAPVCRGCLARCRGADSSCGFAGVRVFTALRLRRVGGDRKRLTRFLLVPMLLRDPEPAPRHRTAAPALDLDLDLDLADPAAAYCLLMTARALLPALDAVRALAGDDAYPAGVGFRAHPRIGCSGAPRVLRAAAAGSRQFCDQCMTSIMGAYLVCAQCQAELCAQCFAEWDDGSVAAAPRVVETGRGVPPTPRIGVCHRSHTRHGARLSALARHRRSQFVRVAQFAPADVAAVAARARDAEAMRCALACAVDCGGPVAARELGAFDARVQQLCQAARRAHALDEWEMPVVSVDAGAMTAREFSRLWQRGHVIVVRGLLGRLDARIWEPQWWIRCFGAEAVRVLDCARGAEPVGEWPLRDFYRLFDGDDRHAALFAAPSDPEWPARRARVERGILKLKDWPPADDFQARLPEHFERFMAALPFPEYTQRRGRLNLANRLPRECVPPDLGPKLYCAYGSSDAEGGVGTTNLHCDMADAVNVMAYAAASNGSRDGGAAAVWDIYPPEMLANVRTFIREAKAAAGQHVDDPIHDQSTFLTRPQRRALYERFGADACCYRVYQNPGDAVFVPAGSAHQVCNYAAAVKVAMDFVSPERVDHCRQLTAEFRRLDRTHPRSRDLLQLNSILWWTFAGGADCG